MAYWLIAVGLLVIGIAFELQARRPRTDVWAFRVRLHWALRVLIVVVLCFVLGVALVAFVVSFDPIPMLGGPSESPGETMGAGFALAMAGVVLHMVLKYGDLVITPDGFRMFHVFIPWSVITRLNIQGSSLDIWTRGHRRSWNAWTGRALLPLWPWESPRKTAERIQETYRDCRQGAPET